MPINDSSYLNEPEVMEFLYHLRNCVPTHYGDENKILVDSFRGSKFLAYPTHIYPNKLIIDMCIVYSKKFATYNPGKETVIEKIFYASMPLAIWCSEEGASDRNLIWGNGGITLTKDDELILFLDEELAKKIMT